jgi:hypothetical protein
MAGAFGQAINEYQHGGPQSWSYSIPNLISANVTSVVAADLFLSAVTIGEIELGIARQRVLNASFPQDLADWLDITLRAYDAYNNW